MRAFTGVDFMDLDSLLRDDEKEARRGAREFTDERVLPFVADWFERADFPRDLPRHLGRAGFLGASLSGYGCAGMGEVAYGLIMQELERGDSAVRTFASVQSALVMFPIHRFGSEEQKERWLPGLAEGRVVGCFGLTEPDHGSNPAGMAASARRDGDSYVLDGDKKWIGNATIADVALIWARNELGVVEGYLVERGTRGFETSLITGKLSLRAAVTGEIRLRNCRIPGANRLPGAQGLKSTFQCLTKARYGIAWGAIGAAMACFHEASAYAGERVQFGRPIGSFQLVQARLADMLTEITKMQFVTLQAGRLMEQGRAAAVHISMIKRDNVRQALAIAREARDILGANGITLDFAAGRHLCNLESVKTYEGTDSIHALILGEHITGIRAFAP